MTSRANYDGLTRLRAAGTWSPQPSTFPIVLDKEIRGGLRYCSGSDGDTPTNIPASMLQEGMLVYNEAANGAFAATSYYRYNTLAGENRDATTGALPNNNANWTRQDLGGTAGEGAQAVADVAALNTLAGTFDEGDNGTAVQLLDSTDFNDTDETDPDITGIPVPVPFTPGADITVIVSWVQPDADTAGSWLYQRFVRNNPDAAYVNVGGDTMTGDLNLNDGSGVVFQNDDENQTVALNADDCTQSYTLTLPPTRPSAANRFLRAVGDGTGEDQELEWTDGAGGGGSTTIDQINNVTDADGVTTIAEGSFLFDDDTNRFYIAATSEANADGDTRRILIQLVP